MGNFYNIQIWDNFGPAVVGEDRDTTVHRCYKVPPKPKGMCILRKKEESRKFPSIELSKTKFNNFLK